MYRRELLKAGAAAMATAALSHQVAQAHNVAGAVVPPALVPSIRCRVHDSRELLLHGLLHNRTTALQLMFTGCSAVCPIQGALFADVQQRLDARPASPSDLQLLSISIDPLADDHRALAGWLRRYGAGARWRAASPDVQDLDRWLDFLQGRQAGADRHTAQVYLFDRRARLALRTTDFPPAGEVLRLLDALAAQAV